MRRSYTESLICLKIGEGKGMVFGILNWVILGLTLNYFLLQMNGKTFLKELVEEHPLGTQNFKKIPVTLWNFVFGLLIEGRLWRGQVTNSKHISYFSSFLFSYDKLRHDYISTSIGYLLIPSLRYFYIPLFFWLYSAWYDVL